MARKPDPGSPFAGVNAYSVEDVGAIQAVYRTPEGQRALTYIIETLAATYDQSFRPDSERSTAFAEGRRFVGLQLIKLVKINQQLLRDKNDRSDHRDPSRDPSTERAGKG